MSSVTIRNLDDAVKRNARVAAARNGRSLEAELRALLERAYSEETDERAARLRAMSGAEFVDHLIATANGTDLRIPERRASAREAPDYPEMAPLPGESLVDHIVRISRPGIDLNISRERTPHEGPSL